MTKRGTILEGLALAGFGFLLLFWLIESGYLIAGFARNGVQGAWDWLLHVTPSNSVLVDPSKHEVLLSQIAILAITVLLGWLSRRLWTPIKRGPRHLRGGV
jgi:hypothetical protein